MAAYPNEFMLTLAQAIALHRVYQRAPIYFRPAEGGKVGMPKSEPLHQFQEPMTFEEFALTAELGSDCIMIPWFGMWLGIEKDGYTHS